MAIPEQSVELAGPIRRLVGYIVDSILLGVVAIVAGLLPFVPDDDAGFLVSEFVALIVGGSAWFLIVRDRGQSPAKMLLRMRAVRDDGRPASLGWMLLRDIWLRYVLFLVFGIVLGLIGIGWIVFAFFAVAALWCVWDKNRQCLWDKAAGTRVVLSPANDLSRLSADQFEERRQRELERL